MAVTYNLEDDIFTELLNVGQVTMTISLGIPAGTLLVIGISDDNVGWISNVFGGGAGDWVLATSYTNVAGTYREHIYYKVLEAEITARGRIILIQWDGGMVFLKSAAIVRVDGLSNSSISSTNVGELTGDTSTTFDLSTTGAVRAGGFGFSVMRSTLGDVSVAGNVGTNLVLHNSNNIGYYAGAIPSVGPAQSFFTAPFLREWPCATISAWGPGLFKRSDLGPDRRNVEMRGPDRWRRPNRLWVPS